MIALYVGSKLLIIFAWLLASLRLAAGRVETRLLSLSARQIGWIFGLFGFAVLALAVRVALTKGAAVLLEPFHLSPMALSMAGVVAHLATFMYVQVRLTPGLIGVLLGDRDSSLGWSWRTMKRQVGTAIVTVVGGAIPFFICHIAFNSFALPAASVARGLVLTLDGAVMAGLLLVYAAGFTAIYKAARERGEEERVASPALAV